MKNMVNLYHPEFHPKLQLLTLTRVIATWILALIVGSLLYFNMAYQQQSLLSEMANIEQTKLQLAIDNQNMDPALLKKIEENQQSINVKKLVLDKLSVQESLKSNSFSKLMLDLATYNPSGLWLTHISLYGKSVLIEGAADDSAIIPKWVSLLGQTDYFRGQEFSDTRLYRDTEQQLNFMISTGKVLPIQNGSNNE
jgi:Tfp pilus assembly protein PilN